MIVAELGHCRTVRAMNIVVSGPDAPTLSDETGGRLMELCDVLFADATAVTLGFLHDARVVEVTCSYVDEHGQPRAAHPGALLHELVHAHGVNGCSGSCAFAVTFAHPC